MNKKFKEEVKERRVLRRWGSTAKQDDKIKKEIEEDADGGSDA